MRRDDVRRLNVKDDGMNEMLEGGDSGVRCTDNLVKMGK